MSVFSCRKQVKHLRVFALSLIAIVLLLVTTLEADSQFYGNMEDLPENERMLLDDGYEIAPYYIAPFGSNHFFYKPEGKTSISETTFGKCTMSGTFIPENIPTRIILKFPNDLFWPGMYENSTFYSLKNHFAKFDENGNNITPKIVWEKIEPDRGDDFTTLEFDLKGEVSHFVVNMTKYPEPPIGDVLNTCPNVIPNMQYDYYDKIDSKDTQILMAERLGFPPDTYVCPNNLIGAMKAADDTEVCVKPYSKTKLVERGWAKDFS